MLCIVTGKIFYLSISEGLGGWERLLKSEARNINLFRALEHSFCLKRNVCSVCPALCKTCRGVEQNDFQLKLYYDFMSSGETYIKIFFFFFCSSSLPSSYLDSYFIISFTLQVNCWVAVYKAFIMVSKGAQLFHITGKDTIFKSS